MGPKRDPGSSLLQSACPSLPGEGVERPRPDDLKWGGGRCIRLVEAGKGQAWGKRTELQEHPSACQLHRAGRPARTSAPGSGLRAPAYSRGAPSPCCEHQHVCPILSALVCMVQLQPTPSLFIFYCSPLLPHPASPNPSIHPHPQAKPSSPGSSCSRSGVWSRVGLRGCGPRPARTDWRGGALGQPASAAQPRPFTHGRGESQTQPPALDAFACVTHPGPAQWLLMHPKVPLQGPFSPKGVLKPKPQVPASMQLAPTLPILDKAAPLADTSRNGRTTG